MSKYIFNNIQDNYISFRMNTNTLYIIINNKLEYLSLDDFDYLLYNYINNYDLIELPSYNTLINIIFIKNNIINLNNYLYEIEQHLDNNNLIKDVDEIKNKLNIIENIFKIKRIKNKTNKELKIYKQKLITYLRIHTINFILNKIKDYYYLNQYRLIENNNYIKITVDNKIMIKSYPIYYFKLLNLINNSVLRYYYLINNNIFIKLIKNPKSNNSYKIYKKLINYYLYLEDSIILNIKL